MKTLKALAVAGLFIAGMGTAYADRQGDALLGALLGGGGGAWIGSNYGPDGAIVGGGLGALAGSYLATDHGYRDHDHDRYRYRDRDRDRYYGYRGDRYYGYGYGRPYYRPDYRYERYDGWHHDDWHHPPYGHAWGH